MGDTMKWGSENLVSPNWHMAADAHDDVKPDFVVKDSGKRQEYESGMVRDTQEGKVEYHRVLEGPMFERWAEHLRKGAVKYPDRPDGRANWTFANSEVEYNRFKRSALRHFMEWFRGDVDEDHAAAVFFNINCAEYTLEVMRRARS